MAFPTAQVDLNGFIYNQDDLKNARAVMQSLITKLIPEWIEAPVGVFAHYWNNESLPGVLHVIDIARTLYGFGRTITGRSQPVYNRKVIQLLTCLKEREYEELLAEIRIGMLFGERAGPISCEPLVPPELLGSSSQPSSPDYAIRLPDGDVAIEVTMMRVEVFDSWDRAMTNIGERITSAVKASHLMKEVDIKAPLGIRAYRLTKSQLSRLTHKMSTNEKGVYNLPLGIVNAQVAWRKIPVIRSTSVQEVKTVLDKFEFHDNDSSTAVFHTDNMAEPNACSIRVFPILTPAIDDLILKSLRNCLERKRNQIPRELQSLLVIQLGGWRIPPHYIDSIVTKRIWPNKLYKWLTGIGLSVPCRTYQINDPKSTLTVNWNTQPMVPRTNALNELIENGAQFYHGKFASSQESNLSTSKNSRLRHQRS
jgi:hypothetical protein